MYRFQAVSHCCHCWWPSWGLLPERETGVTQFFAKYPQNYHRNKIMVIFDFGVDPGAPGLQITSGGKPKVIERFDCSGWGDVNTRKVPSLSLSLFLALLSCFLSLIFCFFSPFFCFVFLFLYSSVFLFPIRLCSYFFCSSLSSWLLFFFISFSSLLHLLSPSYTCSCPLHRFSFICSSVQLLSCINLFSLQRSKICYL